MGTPIATQLTLFDAANYDPVVADESLEQLLQDWDVLEDGTLVRKRPMPFTAAWYCDKPEYAGA